MTHQPLPPGPAPTSWIRLTVQGNAFTSNMISPKVRLNGYPVPSSYGVNVFPVPPGHWHIDVDCQWLRTYGQAALDLDLAEGQTVEAFYAPPHHQFSTGRIGFQRQQRPGLTGLALLLGIPLAFVLLVIVLSVI